MSRSYGALTAPEVAARLHAESVLCLPVGAYEQHGPHLPLRTDTLIAEGFTARLVERHGAEHDLWALPAIPYGLSLEHAWSPGTISLRVRQLAAHLDAVLAEFVRATPARRVLIVNGHGGNRGILEAATLELARDHALRICVVHPSSLATVTVESALPEVHAGLRETSVVLALAPAEVHLERLTDDYRVDPTQRDEIRRLVLARGTTWPWTSDDDRISSMGVIGGDARAATAELGETVLESALAACPAVLEAL